MSLFLSDVSPEIKRSIDKKKQLINDKTNATNWFYKRAVWSRMTSLAKIGVDSNIRRKWVLFGGVLNSNQKLARGFSDMYNLSDDYYSILTKADQLDNRAATAYMDKLDSSQSESFNPFFGQTSQSTETTSTDTNSFDPTITDQKVNVPMPGITQIKISNKGSMGSVREATVNFECHDMRQLNMLELLYMSPGVSIVLEWGWSIDLDGNPIDINVGAQEPMFDHCANKKIQKYIKQTGGNYDGMQGVITNFNWEFNEQGGASCSVTIVSMAETFLSIDTHSTSKNNQRLDVEEGDKSPSSVEENFLHTLWSTYDSLKKNDVIELDNKIQAIKLDKMNIKRRKFKDSSDWWEEDHVKNSNDMNFFVSWEYFERYFINDNFSYISEDQSQQMDSDCIEDLQSTNAAKKSIFPVLDSSDVLLDYQTNLVSADPTICMLSRIKTDDTRKWKDVPYILLKEHQILGTYNVSESLFKDDKIKLSRILINLGFIHEMHKQTNSLSELVRSILNGISEACGNIWTFNLMIDEEYSHKIKIVENNTTFKDEQKTPLIIPTHNVNSIARSISFSTELDSKMKSQMMYGANKTTSGNSQTSNSTDFKMHGYNFFGKDVSNLATGKIRTLDTDETKSTKSGALVEAVKKFLNVKTGSNKSNRNKSGTEFSEEDYLDDLFPTLKELWERKVTPERISAAKTALTRYVTECILDDETLEPKPQYKYLILPVTMSLTIDGSSGLMFGNMIDVSYKPARYNNHVYFQITNISHDLSTSGDWTTSIETIMRVDLSTIIKGTQIKTKSSNKSGINIPKNSYPDRTIIPDRSNSYTTWDKTSNTVIKSLHPKIRQAAANFINDAEKQGFKLRAYCGLRTFNQQQKLYDRGRKTDEPKVTWALPGTSYHNYALAMDVVEVSPYYGFKEGYDQNRWLEISKLGKKHGFAWGGDWSPPKVDKPHWQLTFGYSIKQLQIKHDNDEYDKNGYLIL